ncbi:MAG: oligosaccharide flippase family protein [Candidatus Eisenbacteria bacterium]
MSGTWERASSAAPWSLAAKAIRFGFSLATSMLVVRLLSAHDYGVLAIVRTALAFVAAFVGFGMGSALIRYLPERETRGGGGVALFRFCSLVQAAGWIAFTALAWLLREPLDRFYGSPVGTPLVVGLALLSGNLLFSLASNSLTAVFRTRRLAGLQGLLSVLILVLSWLALRAGWGVIGVLAATSLPHLVLGAWAAISLMRSVSREPASPERGRILRFAVPLAAIEVLNLITWRQSETILLGHFRGPEEAGIWDVAYRLPQLLLEFVPETIWPIVLAAFVVVYTRDPKRVAEMARHYFRLLFVLVTPITIFGTLYGDLLVQVLYGAERAASGPYARFFFLLFHVSFYGTPLSMTLYLIEKTWVNLALSAIFAAINLGLDFLFIPRYGLIGAIPPVAIAIGLSPLLRAWAVRRWHGPIGIPWRFLGRCYLASASVALFYPLRPYGGGPAGFALLLVGATLLFLISVRLVRLFGPEERALIERSKAPGKAFLLRWLFPGEGSR